MSEDLTTLVCLFHHTDHAQAALQDLSAAGIPQSAISLIDGRQSGGVSPASSLEELGVPEHDLRHLVDGIRGGGVVVAVASIDERVGAVERIFGKHQASKIDEAAIQPSTLSAAPAAALTGAALTGAAMTSAPVAGEAVIPVVEEELVVGKRQVSAGGVRVYRRVVETPAEAQVNLREEHVTVERQAVNRAADPSDFAQAGNRTIELTETAEEAVVGKTARVVEEVRVGKEATEHAEQIHDTVRSTQVEVEEIAPSLQQTTAATTGVGATRSDDITRGGL